LEIDSIFLEDWQRMLQSLDLRPLAGRSFLLTGASGLIGRYIAGPIALANRLHGLNCRLVCVAGRNVPPTPGLESGVEWRRIDLSAPVSLNERFDFILHAAGYAQPKRWFANRTALVDINVGATRALLDVAAASNGTLLFCSTVEVYGEPPPSAVPTPETYFGAPDPESKRAIYGEAKRLGEVLCVVYREDRGVRAYAARISHLYGPGISLDDDRVVADFMRSALAGQPVRLRDLGGAVKSLGYVADAAIMLFQILFGGRHTIYNVGGIDRISIRGLADRIAAHAGGVPVIVPAIAEGAPHIGSAAKLSALDLDRFFTEFGQPVFTDLDTGLRRMIAWNRQRAAAESGFVMPV
jgi:dTDP-glucose 4,6-dehydratase/UDP-glucuronate decarboxylase